LKQIEHREGSNLAKARPSTKSISFKTAAAIEQAENNWPSNGADSARPPKGRRQKSADPWPNGPAADKMRKI